MIVKSYSPFNVEVGDEVGFARSGSWDTSYSLGYTVKAITPTGQIVVVAQSGNEYRFNGRGEQMQGRARFNMGYSLVSADVAKAHIDLRAKRHEVQVSFGHIQKVINQYNNVTHGDRQTYLEGIAKLETFIAEARKAAESFPQ